MSKKMNSIKFLRILGISILLLNFGSILASAADSNVYFSVISNAHIYIDGVYRGDSEQGTFLLTLPAATTHALRVTAPGYDSYEGNFRTKQGYTKILIPMISSAWGWSKPTPAPTSTSAPELYYSTAQISTPAPYYTPIPASAPEVTLPDKYSEYSEFNSEPTTSEATLSDKYLEINSEPSGANVYYGSTLIGTTPFTYKVPYGQKITFKLPGYNDKVTYIEELTRSPFKVYLAKSFI